ESGVRRVLNAATDATGAFVVAFKPLPNEAGDYQVAAAHPGVLADVTQDRFTLIGMQVIPATTTHKIIAGNSVTQNMQLQNLSGVDLTNVSWAVLGAPANLNVTVVPPSLALLPGRTTRPWQYTVQTLDDSVRQA